MGRPRPELIWFFPGQIERGCSCNRRGRDETDTEEGQSTGHFPEADRLTRHLKPSIYTDFSL
jgi:hypothetical protein